MTGHGPIRSIIVCLEAQALVLWIEFYPPTKVLACERRETGVRDLDLDLSLGILVVLFTPTNFTFTLRYIHDANIALGLQMFETECEERL